MIAIVAFAIQNALYSIATLARFNVSDETT